MGWAPKLGEQVAAQRHVGAVGEIAALISRRGPADADRIEALITGCGGPLTEVWREGAIAVGCAGGARLAVAPDLVVAIDGRLDNARELAQVLGVDRGLADVYLVLEGWRRRGRALLDALVGDLAIVVADRRRGRVVCLRDLCGGRALHVSGDDETWLASTEWQPLWRARRARAVIDREWFASGFVGQTLNPIATQYEGVHTVLPGHAAEPALAGWHQARQAVWHVPRLCDRRPGAYASEFRALFDEAVRCRVAGLDRVGVSLSGGVDSTSVMTTAAVVAPEVPRHALSLGITDPGGDERDLQRLVAAHAQSELHWVDVGDIGPMGRESPTQLFDELGAPPLVINWFLSEAQVQTARLAGVTTSLDGEDGDGVVGGNPLFLADLLITGRWHRWLEEVNALRALDRGPGRALFEFSLYWASPPPVRRMYDRRQRSTLAPDILADDLLRGLDLEGRLAERGIRGDWSPGRMFRRGQSDCARVHHVSPVFTAVSEPWRRGGIQLAHPWNDRRLVSFCLGLPFEHVSPHGRSKVVLRQAMSDRLPGEILERPHKADLSGVARRAAHGRDARHIREGLHVAREQAAFFSPSEVEAIAARFEAGDSVAEALRLALFAQWVRWCDEG